MALQKRMFPQGVYPRIKFFYDLETTGTDYRRNCIHQLSGFIEVDGDVWEEFDFHLSPHPKAVVEEKALEVGGVTLEQIKAYPDWKLVKLQITEMLSKYVNRYDKKSRMWLVGYNNRSFDDQFFRKLFELSGDEYFNSYFYSDSRDVLVLASEYLEDQRMLMRNFQLHTVAEALGIKVEDDKLHNALYDVYLTRQIYCIVTGKCSNEV
jgi:DNA polymerase-3 subunit epsilon